MMILKNAQIVNENRIFKGCVILEGALIKEVIEGELPISYAQYPSVDLAGKYLIPGVIDDQVHFRDPGLNHKADMQTESMAAIAGGVTSFLDMPNTLPQTVTADAFQWKLERGAQCSYANYGFYIGANNENVDAIKTLNPKQVAGVKVFMGSSTGNMLVDSSEMLTRIFSELDYVITTHCEEEAVIKRNIAHYTAQYGEDLPIKFHPLIRSEEACYTSSAKAVALAHKYQTRLHLLHLSTAKELTLIEDKPLEQKRVTGEVCVHHLWFSDQDYEQLGNKIKWNPSIKTLADRDALVAGVRANRIDVIATDHAPHTIAEKQGNCLKAASGGPMIQYSLLTMLELVKQGKLTLETVIHKMCHTPAALFQIDKRGYIRPGYYADLVVIDPQATTLVDPGSIISRCAWSPVEGYTYNHKVETTFVNGQIAYQNGMIHAQRHAMALTYNH